jgi:hypothetical protein
MSERKDLKIFKKIKKKRFRDNSKCGFTRYRRDWVKDCKFDDFLYSRQFRLFSTK